MTISVIRVARARSVAGGPQLAGQESGWLPIETGLIGAGYGIASGLTPGDGGQQAGSDGQGGTGGTAPGKEELSQIATYFQ
jgi:hypothetical protein